MIARNHLSWSSASASLSDCCIAISTVYILAMLLKARMSPARIALPASQLSGESALGFRRRLLMARVTLSSVHCTFQCCGLSTSRQISPVSKCTFGWNTRVRNFTLGGADG